MGEVLILVELYEEGNPAGEDVYPPRDGLFTYGNHQGTENAENSQRC